jgi:hypothetical protein
VTLLHYMLLRICWETKELEKERYYSDADESPL